MCERHECFRSTTAIVRELSKKEAGCKNVGVQNLEPLHFYSQHFFRLVSR